MIDTSTDDRAVQDVPATNISLISAYTTQILSTIKPTPAVYHRLRQTKHNRLYSHIFHSKNLYGQTTSTFTHSPTLQSLIQSSQTDVAQTNFQFPHFKSLSLQSSSYLGHFTSRPSQSASDNGVLMMGMLSDDGTAALSQHTHTTLSVDQASNVLSSVVTDVMGDVTANITEEYVRGNMTEGTDLEDDSVTWLFVSILLIKALLMSMVILLSVLGNLLVIVSVVRLVNLLLKHSFVLP